MIAISGWVLGVAPSSFPTTDIPRESISNISIVSCSIHHQFSPCFSTSPKRRSPPLATRHLHIEDATLRIPEVLRGQVVGGHVAILHQVQTGHLGEWQRVQTFKQLGIVHEDIMGTCENTILYGVTHGGPGSSASYFFGISIEHC